MHRDRDKQELKAILDDIQGLAWAIFWGDGDDQELVEFLKSDVQDLIEFMEARNG